MPIPRLIPTTIIVALLFVVFKAGEVTYGTHLLTDALAQGGEAPAEPATNSAQETTEKPASEEKSADNEPESTDNKDESGKKSDTSEPAKVPVKDNSIVLQGRFYSAVELELLEKLALRREELDRWEDNIKIKEAALEATEKRVAEKIAQIEEMRASVTDLLAQFNEKEDAKIRSLVKIYESMKPKDASRIFDELEMPVLLMVIDKMAEKKAALILAGMDPEKAKQVTLELAQQRRLNTGRLSDVTRAVRPSTSPSR